MEQPVLLQRVMGILTSLEARTPTKENKLSLMVMSPKIVTPAQELNSITYLKERRTIFFLNNNHKCKEYIIGTRKGTTIKTCQACYAKAYNLYYVDVCICVLCYLTASIADSTI